ncbi:Ureidoglycolate lyase [Defluviimonas aquaemixtae]|uniref:Ureidoglycolate lyase n=1 Tax=Albidovulum aquaemixtae TaxID=1542388 RepID=A0A2R8B4G1_9RHOB|nr:ureidoglycolate lyase [Defluviimonas aquaemixtae]SPH17498.1 Ureidoglycolate lyase [Defluviimonas aquaemixtae]
MTERRLVPAPLTAEAFAPFGDVIEVAGAPDKLINQGLCGRHHDRARLDFADGRAGISLFDAQARTFPYAIDMVERHPEGSQAFVPLDGVPFLVVVADDAEGRPVNPKAFVTRPGQSVNLLRGVWHGVLAPIERPGKYIVIDRIGAGPNLEEHWFDAPYIVETAKI